MKLGEKDVTGPQMWKEIGASSVRGREQRASGSWTRRISMIQLLHSGAAALKIGRNDGKQDGFQSPFTRVGP